MMNKSKASSQIEVYFSAAKKWQKELKELRRILRDYRLTEELKWGKPCNSFQGGNIVILLPLKNYCALLFCKGALLRDPHGILIKPGENTQAARQVRFSGLQDIIELESVLRELVRLAIEAEKAGMEVRYKNTDEYAVPEEFQAKLDQMQALKVAFQALTSGRQRGYLLYFSAAKQAKTREARVDKCIPRILEGKGLMDV